MVKKNYSLSERIYKSLFTGVITGLVTGIIVQTCKNSSQANINYLSDLLAFSPEYYKQIAIYNKEHVVTLIASATAIKYEFNKYNEKK